MSETPLWAPSEQRRHASQLANFADGLEGFSLDTHYDELHRFSIDWPREFWTAVASFCGVVADWGDGPALVDGDKMPGAKFFPEAKLNFAENLLRKRGPEDALVFWGEDQVKRRLSWDALQATVARLARALKAEGVGPGDRVAGFMPNMPEATIAMLATTALGAVWTSCSPDFGVTGVLDRFGQVAPKVLFCPDGYIYNGKRHDSLARVAEFSKDLPSVTRIVVCPYLNETPDLAPLDARAERLADFVAGQGDGPLAFERVAFNAPLYVMYSSGTTGKPKCIVHGVGGTLLQHLKEHRLLCDVKAGDRVFYFTTCGWMMWNWLVTGLASEATLLLYDGSPFAPDGNILWDYAAAEKATLFGTSAKYIDALAKADLAPKDTHDLSALRLITSTGSPLVAEGFDYVYEKVKADVCLSSISGGTDIISCFIGGSPLDPVWRGEIQRPGLGMAVEVWDDEGQRVVGDKGELVCVKPFPCMPLGFWDDPDDARYKAAYFEKYPNIWCHGDFIVETEHGGYVVYGRSDATLNPGGVRIGTAEIYRQVERLPEVEESIVVGQDWQDDVRVVLFVRLRPGVELDEALIKTIRQRIREGCTPRHVPAKVIAVADIPRTKSGKIVELAVRDVIHGRQIKNKEALANPEALDLYRDLPDLQD